VTVRRGGGDSVSALAFDYGTRRIGVALTNPVLSTARELCTVPARNGVPAWPEIDALVAMWQPGVLVVGLPYNADGSESAMTERTRGFAGELAGRYGLPVESVDERYTSAEASELLRERRRSGTMQRRVRDGDVDRLAARLIAETWLREGGAAMASR
jgi:putative Holliday junction resolvase